MKCRAGEKTLSEAADLAREAEQASREAATLAGDPASIAERRRELQRLERQLGAKLGERDLEEFVRQCASGDGLDAASLEEKLESIRADRDRRTGRIAELQREVSRAEGSIEPGSRSWISRKPRSKKNGRLSTIPGSRLWHVRRRNSRP